MIAKLQLSTPKVLLVFLVLVAVAACGGGSGGDSSSSSASSSTSSFSSSSASSSVSSSSSVSASLFWLEPTTSTTIGVGQVINVFSALKNSAAEPYPSYVDPTLVTWTSSNPAFASINSNGVVIGLSEGTATITAQYQGHSSQLTVQVSGAFISRNIAVLGQGTRKYSIYVPPFGSDTGPHAVIVSLHGGG